MAISVVGSAADERCQAVEVTLPSWAKLAYKSTTVPPHVTVSVVEEGEAREAGVLINERRAQGKIEPVHGLRVLHGIVGVCLTDRSVVYSAEELLEAIHLSSNKDDDDDGEGDGGVSGSDEECLPPPPLPSNRLLNLENEVKYTTTAITSSSATAMVDLVSLLHQCFTSVAPPLGDALPSPAPAASPSTAAAGDDAVDYPNTNRRPSNSGNNSISSRQQQSIKPLSRNTATASTSKRRPRVAAAAAETEFTVQSGLEAAESERATMNAQHTAYKTALSISKRAKSAGNHAAARAHALTAHRHSSASVRARQRSSRAAFHAHNSGILNTFKLDLHGMHVKEAVNKLKQYVEGLAGLQHPGGILLKVVTGFGQHSQIPGRAKVLPAVVEYLAEAGVLFDVEEENPGMVRVLLEPQLQW